MDSQYPTNFTNDAINGVDVSGGWFDCGDHAMYGQTQYWSAYTLAQAYNAFPTGFDDLYNGLDYSDYKKSQNFDIGGGTPNGIPDIIDELVYETDFIAKAAISEAQFVAKKGIGNLDHALWTTPGYQSAKKKASEGGASDVSRSITVDQGDGPMACYAAATLALMSRTLTNLGVYSDRADLYAKKAAIAYAYGKNHPTTVAVSDGGAYPANANYKDDFVTASLEMYRLTNDGAYLKAATDLATGFKWGNNGLCYNDNEPQAFYNLYTIGGVSSSLSQISGSSSVMNRYVSNINTEGVSTVGDAWGPLRYPLNGAYLGGLVGKATNSETYDQFIYNQVDFVMGANTAKRSFITGFCSGCTNQPKYPHHRGIYLVDDLVWQKFNATKSGGSNGLVIPDRNKFHGSLLGGGSNRSSTGFTENIDDATTNEVCTDYNVGLVGALGYIVSKLAPVDTSKFGAQTSILHSRSVGRLSLRHDASGLAFRAPAGQTLSQVTVLDASGREVWSSSQSASEIRWTPGRSGLYIAQAIAGDQRLSATVAVP
jgi:endoglucanase